MIEDFLYQYKSLHRERVDPKRLPKGELPLLNGILESTVTFTVQRAENWSSTRCGREQRRDFYHLMTVLDAASGAELARVTLSPSGLWATKSLSTNGTAYVPLPDPEAAMREVGGAYNLQGDSPQYIVSLGSISCADTTPCLAFRHGNDVYIFYRHGVFEDALFKIAGNERQFDLRPEEALKGFRAVIPTLRTDGTERPFHLGGTTWTIARKVKRPSPAGVR